MVKKIISGILAAIILIAPASVNSFAKGLPDYTMTEAEWNEYWQANKDNNRQISLTPGADATKLNFNWHSELKLGVPAVRISKSRDMSGYREFRGYFTPAEIGEQTNRVTACGLEENTVYYYTYGFIGESFSEPTLYRTLGTAGFKAMYIGDIQCGFDDDGYANVDAGRWNTILSSALRDNDDISLILSLGDNTQHGDNKYEWAGTLAPKALRTVPIATVVGNHDNKGHNYQYYVNNPNSYWGTTGSIVGRSYYFRYGDVLFICLNANSYNVIDIYNCVEKAVSENTDAKWRVMMMHHDVYGTGHHARKDESLLMQDVYSAICDKFGIDVCLAGHDHLYGRSFFMYDDKKVDMDYTANKVTDPTGTLYLTAASGSAKNRVYEDYIKNEWIAFDYMTDEFIYSTVEFTENTFNVSTYDIEGRLIDTYTIEKTNFDYPEVDTDDNLIFDTDALVRILRTNTGEYFVIFEYLFKVIGVAVSILPVLFK